MMIFWRLMAKSVIFSGLIALCLIISICIIAINGQQIPDLLADFGLIVVMFFFTTKGQDIEAVIKQTKESKQL